MESPSTGNSSPLNAGHASAAAANIDASAPAPSLSAEETVEARYLHPDAKALFGAVPLMRCIPHFGIASEAFGPKCVFSLGLSEFLCKGIADYLIRFSLLPMFTKRYGVDAMTYQRMSNLSTMGWSIKPFTAMISDMISFFGYTKRWYLAASCVLGAAFALGYGLLPAKTASAPIAAVFVFLTCFSKANVDILTQGHYSRLIRRIPTAGPSLVSWVWCWVLMGSLIAAVIQGPLSDARLEHVGVFVSATLQLLTTGFFILNWYGERRNREDRAEDARFLRQAQLEAAAGQPDPNKKLQESGDEVEGMLVQDPDEEAMMGLSSGEPFTELNGEEEEPIGLLPTCCCGVVEVNKEVWHRNWRIFVYCILMTMGAVAMALVTILGDTWQLLYACVSITVPLCCFAFYALPLVIAKANIYAFISMAAYIQLPGALDNFYTATPACLPDGPHFNNFFYFTVGSIIGSLGGIAGVTLFKLVFSKQSYRVTFIITTSVQIVASIFDLIIVQRWNRPHVSDHVMFVLGDQIVYQVCYMLNFMPTTMLLSRLCPRGSESMVYALLAGFSNFGQVVSNTIGSLLMELKWPVESDIVKGCDFSNVKWLLLVGHFICPLINIPLVFLLIPAARICDTIDIDGRVIKPGKEAGQQQQQEEEEERR